MERFNTRLEVALKASTVLAAIALVLGLVSCAVTSTPPPAPKTAPRFEGVGEGQLAPQAAGSVRISRFRDNVTGAEYLIVTRAGYDGIAVVPVSKYRQ